MFIVSFNVSVFWFCLLFFLSVMFVCLLVFNFDSLTHEVKCDGMLI